jgi:hypothetical protein
MTTKVTEQDFEGVFTIPVLVQWLLLEMKNNFGRLRADFGCR